MTLLAKLFTKTSPDKIRPPDLTKPVDDQIGTYWAWTNAGFPLGNNQTELLQETVEGATCEQATVLAGLARHQSEWVRLAVAGNRATPAWVRWGDSKTFLGLVGDDSSWVSAAAILTHPCPPAELVDEIRLEVLADKQHQQLT